MRRGKKKSMPGWDHYVWSWHILPVPVWVSPMYRFLSHLKAVHER